ncbi:DNA-directed RNA polymerase subunit A' [Nanoarchaeota archaeon]
MIEDEIHPFKKIGSISFGMLSPAVIKKMSVCKVVTPELYDKEGYPVDGGLMDTRMGVIDPGLVCRTDGKKLKDCPGYFGYIELARPAIHIKLVAIILSILRSCCRDCGKVLVNKNKLSKYLEELKQCEEKGDLIAHKALIKKIISSLKDTTKCPHCKSRQHKISLEKPTTFLENEKRISPIEIRARLERLGDDEIRLFGINPSVSRPEWAILTVMAIPPVTMRPSITLESGERSEDDLTHKLGDIVRINQRLFENINAGAPEIIIEDLWDLLQYHVTTFFDNSVPQLPVARHRSGQPLKTLTERIKSKEGRIRHNLAGKRTNFCARTVISPDSMLDLNEVGIPQIVASKLSVPERITDWNMNYLRKFIEKGPDKYPGANYIVRPDGKKKRITDETKEALLEEIQPGYLVERHLMDGDLALFNRQPSLHRMSMMCHRIRVLPYKTFRLNPAVCAPYNADFDGDEMNLHIPQTEEARAEAEVLMQVQTQLISPRYGLSIIGCVQDAISGNYIVTKETELTKHEAIELLGQIGVTDFSKLPNKDNLSGKDLIACIIPEDFNYLGVSKNSEDGDVKIEKGKLISGVLDSKNLGEGSGLLLRNLHKKYGELKTIEILSKLTKLGIYALLRRGFSTGISDTDLPDVAKTKITEELTNAETFVDDLIETYHKGELETLPGKTTEETLELKILEVLNRARNNIGNLVTEYFSKDSGTIKMTKSGARGNPINMAQMSACVGQQALRGKRISLGYKKRTLSCFKSGDLRPKARGFITNGFKSGLSPSEFFFGAMTGRDSLMDTALRTPKSGYLYRRLANAMQDLRVEQDGSVRDATGNIIQVQYGEDGIDVSKSEGGIINVKKIIETVMLESEK